MRISGYLDPPGDRKATDQAGGRSSGGNGNHRRGTSPRDFEGEARKEDAPVAGRGGLTGFTTPDLGNDQRDAFVGGVPGAHHPARPGAGRESPYGAEDRIGGQRLEPEDGRNKRTEVASRSSNGALWFVLMLLMLALGAAGAYMYLGLKNNNVAFSQVPELLESIPTLGGRVDATEAKLRDLAANWTGLTRHLAELDQKVDSNLKATRNMTRVMVGQATGRLKAQLDEQGRVFDARLTNVESTQRQDRAQLEQLNDQLRGQVASLQEQLTAAQANTGADLADLHERVRNDEGNFDTLTHQLHRDKMTFEASKNSPTEIVPGVILTVVKTDVGHQRIRGYVSLTHEGKTLWLNNLSANEAVDLYSQTGSHPYSLIVTTVGNNDVVGYLLLPAGA